MDKELKMKEYAARFNISTAKADDSTSDIVTFPVMKDEDKYNPDYGIVLIKKENQLYYAQIDGDWKNPDPTTEYGVWTHPPDISPFITKVVPKPDSEPVLNMSMVKIMKGNVTNGNQVTNADGSFLTGMAGETDRYSEYINETMNADETDPLKRIGQKKGPNGYTLSSPGGTFSIGKKGITLISKALAMPDSNEEGPGGIAKKTGFPFSWIPKTIVTPFPNSLPNLDKISKIVAICAMIQEFIKDGEGIIKDYDKMNEEIKELEKQYV